MNYVGTVIRPPSEADAIILQVTVGCSYNKCTFCGAYKDIAFSVKNEETILADLGFAALHCRRARRLFLADGDVLILPQHRLVGLFHLIHHHLPWITRISLYGNARAIRSKTREELAELKALGLTRIYMGLESGCDEVLRRVLKGETGESMIAAASRVGEAEVFLSVTALLGLGGRDLWEQHARETAEVLTAMAPQHLALLTLMPLANTELGRQVAAGEFSLPVPIDILSELYLLLETLGEVRCQFHANHASTYLPLQGRLPRDRQVLLNTVAMAMEGRLALVPEGLRAL
jgi:radical SAM superfamily enzyme YgiQ (UPF0313 family)